MFRLFSHILCFEKGPSHESMTALPRIESDPIDIDLVRFLAFPTNFVSGQELFYTFNAGSNTCSCWTYQQRGQTEACAIVIVSQVFQPYLFDELLRAASRFCKTKKINDPQSRQTLIYSVLSSANCHPPHSFVLDIANKKIVVKPDESDLLWLRDRSCSILAKNIESVWNTVVTNGRVLLCGDNAEIVSRAAIEALSLFSSVEFDDKYATFSQPGDPRGEFLKQCRIVATIDKNIPFDDFDLVVPVKRRNRGNYAAETDRVWNKSKECFELMAGLWKISIAYDPYFDIMQRDLRFDEANPDLKKLDPNFLAKAQKSRTFMKIRKGLLDPDKLRMSFLSVEPREAVGVLRDNELEYAYSKVERIAGNKDIQHDQQLLTVLRRHMFLINARRHSIE